ncbi:MAG: zinc ABC transporter solute-binding protein, partial [Anaerolineales bacterium]|nr:zinc ABC transporter solute-binding protein [Anaerolineales bacterium]
MGRPEVGLVLRSSERIGLVRPSAEQVGGDRVEVTSLLTGNESPHTYEIKPADVKTVADVEKIRITKDSYDGSTDAAKPMADVVKTFQTRLYTAIKKYATDTAKLGIVYDPNTNPYFFVDKNGDGKIDVDDKNANIRYNAFTPRLLKAAYNYQTSLKDPGAFAHNSKYIIELLYDSIEDLNTKLGTIDMSTMMRNDPGHFAGNTEPFRHWDAEGEVPGTCARCHSATGLPEFLANGANVANPIANGFMCSTCHDGANWPNRYSVASVTFPSGATVSLGGKDADGNWVADESNLCLECHQGRSSTPSVNKALAGKDPETPDPSIRFSNIHYFAAGATLFGTEVQGAYEFEGQTYVGQNIKHPVNKCKDCHDVHALTVKVETCATCHAGAADPQDPDTYRMDPTDYN